MYKVYAEIWTNDFSDYMDCEYSGKEHYSLEAAKKELKKAAEECKNNRKIRMLYILDDENNTSCYADINYQGN